MKRFLSLLLLTLAALPALAQASRGEITYIGRVEKDGDAVLANWTGAMAIVRFQGKTLSLVFEDSGCDFVNVWVDQEPGVTADQVLKLEGAGTMELARFRKAGEHVVYIQKRTEGEQGCIRFKDFVTDETLLQARPLGERVIEIVGDSYTCGYGTESASRDEPFRSSEENCNLSYSGILGRYFDADVIRVAHSGRGIARNYGGFQGSLMPELYRHVHDDARSPIWEPDYHPDIVLIYLGTNDFSTGLQPSLEAWLAGYLDLLSAIRAFHPGVPVLCVASKANPLLEDYVKEAATRCELPGVHWAALQADIHNDTTDLGASWHPNHRGQRKVASAMAPYIATVTGWELPLKPLE